MAEALGHLCGVCDRTVTLNKDGTLVKHGIVGDGACAGSGQLPGPVVQVCSVVGCMGRGTIEHPARFTSELHRLRVQVDAKLHLCVLHQTKLQTAGTERLLEGPRHHA